VEKHFVTLGAFLKKARLKAEISQHDVAKALGYSSYQFISNWERGISSPPCAVLKRIAALYKTSAQKLFDLLLKDSTRRVQVQLQLEFRKSK
jgi:transcriptional regulator with XRE-family HTH domain